MQQTIKWSSVQIHIVMSYQTGKWNEKKILKKKFVKWQKSFPNILAAFLRTPAWKSTLWIPLSPFFPSWEILLAWMNVAVKNTDSTKSLISQTTTGCDHNLHIKVLYILLRAQLWLWSFLKQGVFWPRASCGPKNISWISFISSFCSLIVQVLK